MLSTAARSIGSTCGTKKPEPLRHRVKRCSPAASRPVPEAATPASLHFINGLHEANRNRAPVILIATQVSRQDIGFESIQEIDFNDVFKVCSIFCGMIVTPDIGVTQIAPALA